MTNRLALLAVAVMSCQQPPAAQLDTTIDPLGPPRGPASVAPVFVSTVNFEPQPPPVLSATASVTRTDVDPSAPGALASITLHVVVKGGTAAELAVEFVTPDGTMYQRLTAPIADAPFDAQPFDFSLPVAGTWIAAQQISGTWNAHVMVGASELLNEPLDIQP